MFTFFNKSTSYLQRLFVVNECSLRVSGVIDLCDFNVGFKVPWIELNDPLEQVHSLGMLAELALGLCEQAEGLKAILELRVRDDFDEALLGLLERVMIEVDLAKVELG